MKRSRTNMSRRFPGIERNRPGFNRYSDRTGEYYRSNFRGRSDEEGNYRMGYEDGFTAGYNAGYEEGYSDHEYNSYNASRGREDKRRWRGKKSLSWYWL
jgi:hypothetical protein